MSDAPNYTDTLFLPKTAFPPRANASTKEPELVESWRQAYADVTKSRKDRPLFVLHDGPPYANGHVHIGHALNKVLKDIIVRSKLLAGQNIRFVPGWDCHGLPIEWEVEKELRAQGRSKADLGTIEFRQRCRAFARHWVDVQKDEFQRLGILADWEHAYETMSFDNEATVAAELMRINARGLLYRGAKPVMWSPAEKTALAEAEVEYKDLQTDAVWITYPVKAPFDSPESVGLNDALFVAYTTTPWTIPSSRALSFSPNVDYGLYRVVEIDDDKWLVNGQALIIADKLAESVFRAAGAKQFARVQNVAIPHMAQLTALHPFHDSVPGYQFDVPLLPANHVTDDLGSGIVHTAPSHGREDYEVWNANSGSGRTLELRGVDQAVPDLVGPDGLYTDAAGPFEGIAVLDAKGTFKTANKAVIDKLVESKRIIARQRVTLSYPHSWRSKTPLIYRATQQWFIGLDRLRDETPNAGGQTLRFDALKAIGQTTWVPALGKNRIRSMVEDRPDWLISRQRTWGVPISIFVNKQGDILQDPDVNRRITEAFAQEGADAWWVEGARERFLGDRASEPWQQVTDILDVWFESGCSHRFGAGRVYADMMAVEGSDQHRGWFQSTILEARASGGMVPFDTVVTHGFVLDQQGRKMSKSEGNVIAPQDVIDKTSADILRLWIASSDWHNDVRLGDEIIQTFVGSYKKIRLTTKWLLGMVGVGQCDIADMKDQVSSAPDAPELERYLCHRLAVVDREIASAYEQLDFSRVVSHMLGFLSVDLSQFYAEVRKDVLYCDPRSSLTRKTSLFVLSKVFAWVVTRIAPILPFLASEAVEARLGYRLSLNEITTTIPETWIDDKLATRFNTMFQVRTAVLGVLEEARMAKKIGSSLEAAVTICFTSPEMFDALRGFDWAELCVVSKAEVYLEANPATRQSLQTVLAMKMVENGIAVRVEHAPGRKCARSWKYSTAVGSDPDYPDVTPRDAQALREHASAL